MRQKRAAGTIFLAFQFHFPTRLQITMDFGPRRIHRIWEFYSTVSPYAGSLPACNTWHCTPLDLRCFSRARACEPKTLAT